MHRRLKNSTAVSIVLFLGATLAIAVLSSASTANALLLKPQDHWKYNVFWAWKPDIHKNIGIIFSQIIVANETADRIEGYMADANGTRLEMYDDQYVMVKYTYDMGPTSSWEIGGKTHKGYFSVDIPENYRDAQTIGLFIGGYSYKLDLLPDSYEQPLVLINSARLDYTTNSTLDSQTSTSSVTDTATTATCQISSDSLIDRILQQFSLSPCLRRA
jgi:hypothetical protein